MNVLTERGYTVTTTADREIVCDINEKLCYVHETSNNSTVKYDNDSELEKYELPNGQFIIESERFRFREAQFQSSLLWMEANGVHETCYSSIMKCYVDTRKDMHWTLSGLAGRLRAQASTLVLRRR